MFDRILVVTLSNIGDAAMTTPVFETLHQLYPSSVIDIVGDERSSEIFLGAPYLGLPVGKHAVSRKAKAAKI
jgi:heptosyltransferase-3